MISPIDEIKNRLNIVEVVGSYIKLQKTGANFRALCPFHSEKRPSFFVSPARQIWHCFGGCGTGGDIFKFVMKIENVEFGDALRILAQRAGIELKRERPELRTERQRLYEICELAARFFERQLTAGKTGREVKKYLISRGINEESIKKWRIGYSPDSWRALSVFLVSKGYNRAEIIKAGLAIQKENIGEISGQMRANWRDSYDRFRGRITFPIFDLNSQVIGFGARVFGEREEKEIAKYVNTPNTLLYDKSRILYGLDKARVEVRKKDTCILVEGYTDVIMASQSDFQNVVATSGTALTPYQLRILRRYSENLLTAFDMDVAGDSATKRGIDLAQTQGFNIKVVTMPPGSDPADILAKNPEDWEKLGEQAKSILDFYFETALSKADPKSPEGKKEISKILLPVIKRIPNKIEQSFWIQELAKKLEVKEADVIEELKKIKLEEDIYGLEPEEIINLPQKSRRELLEERLLTMILKAPQNINLIPETDFFSSKTKIILTNFKSEQNSSFQKISRGPALSTKGRGGRREGWSPEIEDYFNYLSLKAEVEEIEEKDIEPEIQLCLREIQSLEIKQKLDQISRSLKIAEIDKDLEKIEKLIQEFNQCSKALGDLETA